MSDFTLVETTFLDKWPYGVKDIIMDHVFENILWRTDNWLVKS